MEDINEFHTISGRSNRRGDLRVAGASEMSTEKQTPLIESLERVPQDARVVVEHNQFSSSSHPVGRLCHEAAAELRRLHAQVAQDDALLRQALDALDSDHLDIQLRTAIVLRERLHARQNRPR